VQRMKLLRSECDWRNVCFADVKTHLELYHKRVTQLRTAVLDEATLNGDYELRGEIPTHWCIKWVRNYHNGKDYKPTVIEVKTKCCFGDPVTAYYRESELPTAVLAAIADACAMGTKLTGELLYADVQDGVDAKYRIQQLQAAQLGIGCDRDDYRVRMILSGDC